MSEVRRLEMGLGANTDGLAKELARADSMADAFAREFRDKFANLNIDLGRSLKLPDVGALAIKAPEIPSPAGGGAGAVGPDLAASLLPLAGKIQSALQAAAAPLNAFAADFSAKFQVVGSTIVNMARRVDANMKFDLASAAIAKWRDYSSKNVDALEARFGKLYKAVGSGVNAFEKWNKFSNILANIGNVAKDSFGKLSKAANVSVNVDNSTRSIVNMRDATRAATGAMRSFGAQVALSLGAFGLVYKAVDFLKTGITSAVNMGETLDKVSEVFKGNAGDIVKLGDDLGKNFGLDKQVILDGASAFGLLGNAADMTAGQTAKLSKDMTLLAADMSSIYNIPLPQALEKLRSGLSGEAEPLRSLGVFLDEDAVKARGLALGLAKTADALSSGDKIAARASLVMEKSAVAHGNLALTQGSVANQARKLSGTMSNLARSLGQALLPAVATVVGLMNKVATAIGGTLDAQKGRIASFAAALSDGFGKVGTLVSYLLPEILAIGATLASAFAGGGDAVGSIIPSFDALAVGAKSALQSINAGLASFIGAVRSIPAWVDASFGPGTSSLILTIGASVAAVALGVNVLAGSIAAIGAVIAAVTAPLVSIPVLVAAAVVGVGTLTGAFGSWAEVIDTVGFAFRNAGALFDIAFTTIGGHVSNFIARLAVIPGNLAILAGYVSNNWMSLMASAFSGLVGLAITAAGKVLSGLWEAFEATATLIGQVLWEIPGVIYSAVAAAASALMGFLGNIWENIKSLGKAIVKFVKDPMGGVTLEAPILLKPQLKDNGQEIRAKFEAIGKAEAASQGKLKAIAPPKIEPPPAAKVIIPPPPKPAVAKIADADMAATKKIDKFAKDFLEKTATPLEKYNAAMIQAREALKAGLITQKQFDSKARIYAEKEAGIKHENKFAGAISATSKEGYSAILKATLGRDAAPKDLSKPTNAIAKNTDAALGFLKQIADKVASSAVQVFKF